jgi:anti-anti-sigma factor
MNSPDSSDYVVHAPAQLDWEHSAGFIVAASRAVGRALSTNAVTLVVNMSATDWLDSAGLRALVESKAHATEARLSFRLAEPNAAVLRVIDLASLAGVLGVSTP